MIQIGAKARAVGLQTSRGGADYGRREREAAWPAPTCLNAGYLKAHYGRADRLKANGKISELRCAEPKRPTPE